ncbi:hypothetical protein BJX64DRAFT_292651 [Aspergillus heterothallicus]
MFLADTGRIGAMSRSVDVSFPSDPVKTEGSEYLLEEALDSQLSGLQMGVPNDPSATGIWRNNFDPIEAGFGLNDVHMNVADLNNDSLGYTGIEPFLHSTMTGGIPPDNGFALNFNVGSYIESPRSGKETDPNKRPFQPQPPQPPPPPPQFTPHHPQVPIPSQYPPYIPIHIASNGRQRLRLDRIRRNSAPNLHLTSSNYSEQDLKHAHRRASHNVVEKRYRVNLNSKFKSLDEVVHRGTDPMYDPENNNSDGSSLSGHERRQQPPKAAVIDKALKYIEKLEKENRDLKRQLEAHGPHSSSVEDNAEGVIEPGSSTASLTAHTQSLNVEPTTFEDPFEGGPIPDRPPDQDPLVFPRVTPI